MTRPLPVWLAALAAAAAVLVGCGGGVGTGGTGSYTSGTISGFGSVIVNGVRYDDTNASVTDGDAAPKSRDDLRLGMSVEIEAGEVSGGAATAQRIRYGSEIVGLVSSVDAANGRFGVLGQTVQVDPATVFDDSLTGGLAALAVGARIEVHGAWDPAGARYRATRIAPGPAGNLRLRGLVSNLQAGARTVTIGSGAFTWSGATPGGLANGAMVRVQVQPGAAGSTVWTLLSAVAAGSQVPDGRDGEVEGLLTAFTSAQAFSVGGIVVDASAASFPNGSAGLALGVRVKVKGKAGGGVLKASEVRIENDNDRAENFQLEGNIASVDAVAQTFRLRNVIVAWGPQTQFKDGSVAGLVPNAKVRVQGRLSAAGTQVDARQIEFR